MPGMLILTKIDANLGDGGPQRNKPRAAFRFYQSVSLASGPRAGSK